MRAYIKAFIAGFVSTLTVHQGLLWLLAATGVVGATAWNMTPVPPLGVPAVLSLAFWGALWGVVLWMMIRSAEAAGYYVGAFILGAILPSLFALTLVPFLKGTELADVIANISLGRIAIAAALNGTWGVGVAALMHLMQPPR